MSLSAEQQFLIDFKLYQVPATLGVNVPPAAAEMMLGVSQADFDAEVKRMAAEVEQTAQVMLTDPAVAKAIGEWKLAPAAKIMFVGDSITILRRSYAELINAMLKQARADLKFEYINVAQSGFTSGNGLQDTFIDYLAKNPDWVFILYGTNDATRVDGMKGRALVQVNEFRDNMRQIVKAFRAYTPARVILLTPPPLIESLALAAYGGKRLAYDNSLVAEYADAVCQLAKEDGLACVDLFSMFGVPPDAEKFGPDGLHPNLRGQQEMARQLLQVVVQA